MTFDAQLIKAVNDGDVVVLRDAIEKGANLNSRSGGEPLLVLAAARGDSDCVLALISAGAELDCTAYNRENALMEAAFHGHAKCVEILISAGIPLDNKSNLSWAAAHCAIFGGHADCLSLLINAGADIGALGKDGWTPSSVATNAGYPGCLKLLIDAGAPLPTEEFVLGITVAKCNGVTGKNEGKIACLAMLIQAGAVDINRALARAKLDPIATAAHIAIPMLESMLLRRIAATACSKEHHAII